MEKDKVYVFEGKTSTEAIEKGLNELKVSKAKVDIKILESEDKRSFFSILTPRVVKVEMRLKEDVQDEKKVEPKKVNKTEKLDSKDKEESIKNIKVFLDEFIAKLPSKDLKYDVTEEGNIIKVDIDGYLLEEHFMNELNLSNILLKRYSHLLSQHAKEHKTKDLHN